MKKFPEWMEAIVLFLAGICLTGAVWFYFSTKNLLGEIVSISLGVILLLLFIYLVGKKERDKKLEEIVRRNQTERERIDFLKKNLGARIKTDESAKELADIALVATDDISLEIIDALWNCVKNNANNSDIVNQCAFSIGRIVREQSPVTKIRRDKVIGYFIESSASDSETIIDCFAFTLGKIVQSECDMDVRKEVFNIVKANRSHPNSYASKIYKKIWKKIEKYHSVFS